MATATTERSPVEILRAAKERIVPLASWTFSNWAVDANGSPCSPDSPCATRWCAEGSLLAEIGGALVEKGNPVYGFLEKAAERIDPGYGYKPAGINDEVGHGAVLWMFDIAIELAEAA